MKIGNDKQEGRAGVVEEGVRNIVGEEGDMEGIRESKEEVVGKEWHIGVR